MCKSTLDYENVNFEKYVKYDNKSTTGLVWILCSKSDLIGKKAGYFKKTEVALKLFGNEYRVHRVVWLLVYGSIDPTKVIDHIDGNPWNNNISNLRLVTPAENLRNKSILYRNKSGVTGVYFQGTNGCPNYTGKCSIGNKHFSRAFAISKYGEDQAKQLAINWRSNKLKELEAQGIFYTERHGT